MMQSLIIALLFILYASTTLFSIWYEIHWLQIVCVIILGFVNGYTVGYTTKQLEHSASRRQHNQRRNNSI